MSEGQIFNAIVEFFEEDEWDFHWMEGLPILNMNFTGKNGRWVCYAQAREDQEQFVFYSVCPINVPDNRRAKLAEFITRANYGMIIGNFEMDYSDGEIRYKTSIDVEGHALAMPLVKQVVYANVMIMDRYLPGLMSAMYSETSPTLAIQQIEGGPDTPPRSELPYHDDDGLDDEDEEDDDGLDQDLIDELNALHGLDDLEDDDDEDDEDDIDDDDEDKDSPVKGSPNGLSS